MCSIYAIPYGSEDEVTWDFLPYAVGNFNGINEKCLIDTGASVSCLLRESYQSIPRFQALESVPIQPGFWINAASGHKFSLVGCFMINFRVLGREFQRPMYVIESNCAGILGIDYSRIPTVYFGGPCFLYKFAVVRQHGLQCFNCCGRLDSACLVCDKNSSES